LDKGFSQGFIVNFEWNNKFNDIVTMKLFVKETNSYRNEKKINPKELYIYKVLEYLKLGPKVKFLLHNF